MMFFADDSTLLNRRIEHELQKHMVMSKDALEEQKYGFNVCILYYTGHIRATSLDLNTPFS
jgi:hypothetical protein